MATYYHSCCGNCDRELAATHSSVDLTHLECQHCGTLNKTNASPYSYKNRFGQFYALWEEFSLNFIFFYCIPFSLAYYIIFKPEAVYWSLIYGGLTALTLKLFLVIKAFKFIEREQKKMEIQHQIQPILKKRQ